MRLVLALTASPDFLSVDLDATSAFISAPLQGNEQVYMTAVPGYRLPPGHCLNVVKSIYGLATAPLAFYNLCVDVFTKVGLHRLRTDECVFIKYAWNIKGKDSQLKALSADLDVLSSLVDVPEGARVYPSCPHSIAMLILVQYVNTVASATLAVSLLMIFMLLSAMTGASISTSWATSPGGSACATPTIMLLAL